jgi:hypothetical protein
MLTLDFAAVRVGDRAVSLTNGGLGGAAQDSTQQAVQVGTQRLQDVLAGRPLTTVPAEPTTASADPTTVPAGPTTAPADPTTAPAGPLTDAPTEPLTESPADPDDNTAADTADTDDTAQES